MPRTKKLAKGNATIDVALVVIETGSEDSGLEIAIDTSSKVGVQVLTETVDAIKLVKNGKLLAQKRQKTVITGHNITLTDNVFTPLVVKVMQGGQLSGTGDTLKYVPPVAGSDEKGEIFKLSMYSAVYDASGLIVRYEKITYPNCQGSPIGITSEDGVFRISEYVISSSPKTGEAPYEISYVKTLPEVGEAAETSMMMFSEEPTNLMQNKQNKNELM